MSWTAYCSRIAALVLIAALMALFVSGTASCMRSRRSRVRFTAAHLRLSCCARSASRDTSIAREIVASTENNRMEVMSNDWWGEPLGPMLSRVLTEELGQRLPQSVVLSDTGAVSAPPDATIELNIRRLDKDAAGNLVLQAQAGVTFKGRSAPALRSFQIVKAPPASGIPGQVAAASTALGELADGLALMLLARQ